jgi:hypothetical protein
MENVEKIKRVDERIYPIVEMMLVHFLDASFIKESIRDVLDILVLCGVSRDDILLGGLHRLSYKIDAEYDLYSRRYILKVLKDYLSERKMLYVVW